MANDILKFADTATNILTQAEYAADVERNSGNIPGVARSKLVNKVLRQCAFISNAFAAYLIQQVGGDVLDDNDSTALLAKITSAFTVIRTNDNDVINGNFDYWQEKSTFAVTVNNTYTADQFVSELAGSTATVTRQATAGTELFNAKYFHRSTVTSSVGVANFYRNTTRLENVRNSAGLTKTISFWAKADSARDIAIEFIQNFGTGGSPSAEVNTLGVEKISLTTSWQKFTKTVLIPSISGKIIGTNENSYLGINWWYDAGANYDARTGTLGQQSGTFDLAQIKFETGSEVTDFVLSGKTQAGELLNCQRFYEKSYAVDVDIQTLSVTGGVVLDNSKNDSARGFQAPAFKAEKRVLPSVAIYNPGTGTVNSGQEYSSGTNRACSAQETSTKHPFAWLTMTSAAQPVRIQWVANARL